MRRSLRLAETAATAAAASAPAPAPAPAPTTSCTPPPIPRWPEAPSFLDLPGDLQISIFAVLVEEDPKWVRETFPCLNKACRDLFRTRQASPLLETMVVDLKIGGEWNDDWRKWTASRICAWAATHTESISALQVESGHSQDHHRGFSAEDMATLVSTLAPRLVYMSVEDNERDCELLGPAFSGVLRGAVAPAGRLRWLRIIRLGELAAADLEAVGSVTSLEGLAVETDEDGEMEGLDAFPTAICGLPRLRRLVLSGHEQIRALPAAISSLRSLDRLIIEQSQLEWVPDELNALSALTRLKLQGMGDEETESRFPPSLAGLTSLREVEVSWYLLTAVPAFMGTLSGLTLSHSGLSGLPAAVLLKMPALRSLNLSGNRLETLPDDLGFRLRQLREIDLSRNGFKAVPHALASATSLEVIDLRVNRDLQIESPLVDTFAWLPRLRLLKMTKMNIYSGRVHFPWTPSSLAHLSDLAAKLQARDAALNRAATEVEFED